jgi:hypothetical protein
MNSSQSVTAAFGNTVTPSPLFLGTTGGCPGGSLSGSFQVTAPPGVSWTVSEAVSNPYAPATLSASSGSGSGSVTITVHALPQTPTSGFTCSDTLTETYGGTVFFNFSDSTFVDPHANYTYYAVD